MNVYNVIAIMDGWLEEGPPDLCTCDDYGWPSRVADIVLAHRDRKVTPSSKPTPVGVDFSKEKK